MPPLARLAHTCPWAVALRWLLSCLLVFGQIVGAHAQSPLPAGPLVNAPSEGEVETAQVGGEGMGQYLQLGALRCPASAPSIIGIQTRRGTVLDHIQVACARVMCRDGACGWQRSDWGPSAGNPNGGNPTTRQLCANDQIAVGFDATESRGPQGIGIFVGAMRLRCAPIDAIANRDRTGASAPNPVVVVRQDSNARACADVGASAISYAVGRYGESGAVQAVSMFCPTAAPLANACPATVSQLGPWREREQPLMPTPAVADDGLRARYVPVQNQPSLRLPQASQQTGLYVGGWKIEEPGDRPGLTTFLNNDVRRRIFARMVCNPSRSFRFETVAKLALNIQLRENIIDTMRKIGAGSYRIGFLQAATNNNLDMPTKFWRQNYTNPSAAMTAMVFVPDKNQQAGPAAPGKAPNGEWRPFPVTLESMPNVSASQAIQELLRPNAPGASLDCLTGVQVSVLIGIYRTLDAPAFDALHRAKDGRPALHGIGVPAGQRPSSMVQHLLPVAMRSDEKSLTGMLLDKAFGEAAMVPGDYVFRANAADYGQLDPSGSWNGENAIYMGSGRYFGLGVGQQAVTVDQLDAELLKQYNEALAQNRRPPVTARNSGIRWTLLAGPVLNGRLDEAGPFSR